MNTSGYKYAIWVSKCSRLKTMFRISVFLNRENSIKTAPHFTPKKLLSVFCYLFWYHSCLYENRIFIAQDEDLRKQNKQVFKPTAKVITKRQNILIDHSPNGVFQANETRLRVVPLSLSPSCVTRKKTAGKKWPRERRALLAPRISRGYFLIPVFSRVTQDGLSERGTTRSLQ